MRDYNRKELGALFLIRMLVGWHILFEGVSKTMNPEWTAKGFLMGAQGFLKSFFHFLASNDTLLNIIDYVNIVGLILVGLAFMLGAYTRIAAVAGIFLLSLYYLAYPPFPGIDNLNAGNGHFLIVNYNLIEIVTLLIIYVFPTSHILGVDRLMNKVWKTNND